jgi:beta-glucosidase
MLDTCARRVLQLVLKTRSARGLQATGEPHLEEHARLARRAAAESFVLLHNEGGALPFNPEARVALFGASSYDLVAGGTGSGHVNAAYKTNLSDALPHCVGAQLQAEYRRWAQGNTHRNKAAGLGFMQKFLGRGALKEMPLKPEWITEALDSADIALVTIGRHAGEGRDRQPADFELTREERDMLQQVSQEARMRGIKTVVVLNVSGAIETASWRHLADAVLLIWCPGQEGGCAAVDVLTGVVNPSGRLTMTWPERLEDLPSTRNFGGERVTLYAERDSVGYRAFRDGLRRPAYAFGHGRSYTTFREEPLADGRIAVTNTGERPGRHVVMWWEDGILTGFAKTRLLAPGERQVLRDEQTAVAVGKEAEVVSERVVVDAAPVAVNKGADQ